MTDFLNNMNDADKRIVDHFQEDQQPNKLFDPSSKLYKNSELQRAMTIVEASRNAVSYGWLEIASMYAEQGLKSIEISIAKRQAKIVVNTVVPATLIDYHRSRIRFTLKSILERAEDETLKKEIFRLLKEEHSRLLSTGKVKTANNVRPILCNAAISTNDLDYAYTLAKEINGKTSAKVKSDLVVVLNDWILIEAALSCLVKPKESTYDQDAIHRLYKLFFENLSTPSPTGYPKGTLRRRPISSLYNTAYVYYKYFRTEIPFDPVLVMQSTAYGFITQVVEKKMK
jgi:uncharacterized protein (DUF1778 family)